MKYTTIFVFTIAAYYASAEFSDRARNFSVELLYLTKTETSGNFVIAPFGIWNLMTCVALGTVGDSKYQLTRALRLPTNQRAVIEGYINLTKTVLDQVTSRVALASQNFVFLDKNIDIVEDFKRIMRKDLGLIIISLDFKDATSAARLANAIIEKTAVTVSNVLHSSDFAESKMILTNVISFKGLWASPFDTSNTALEPFYDGNENVIGNVNMMYQRASVPYSLFRKIKASVLQLPYGNDRKYCMLIVLPFQNVKVDDVYANFTTISFKHIFDIMDSDVKKLGLNPVDVKLPRFKISTNVVLNRILNQMDIFDIFNPEKAGFEWVSKNLYISTIVHKADIEVTESGTKASASTAAYFVDRIAPSSFEVNRPFIYFVMEKPTATVLFSGIYSKPSVF